MPNINLSTCESFPQIVFVCFSKRAHLQDEVTVRGVSQTQLLLVQVCPEPGQVFVLPADVCGQDQRPQLPLHVHTEHREITSSDTDTG